MLCRLINSAPQHLPLAISSSLAFISRVCPPPVPTEQQSAGGGRARFLDWLRAERDMAVQAQHPSGFAFTPDFRNRGGSYVIEDFQMLQGQGNTVGLYGGHLGGINNATVFSDPQSELTCNASGKRKRPLEEPPMVMPQPNPDYDSNLASVLSPICYPDITASAAGCQQSRLLESAGTSTSGRTASPLTLNLVSQIFHHGVEIDSLIRLQNERLQSGVEEARKRYFKALLWGMEQRAAKRLREKEAELEKARRKNAELEERVRQLATEGEMWFAVARNNESIAASLRVDLEQILLRNAAAAQVKEGYGDTDDDAQSCRSVEATGRKSIAPMPAPTDEVRRWPRAACKSCAEGDVCVLLLPCKHLCLCKSCESKTHACPCCGTVKNACLQIFMP